MRCTGIGKIEPDRRGKITEALEEGLAAVLHREVKQIRALLNRAQMTAAPFTPNASLLNSATATSHATRSTARALDQDLGTPQDINSLIKWNGAYFQSMRFYYL